MAKRSKKKKLIHSLNSSISGELKNAFILPFLAGIFIAGCIYTFFLLQNDTISKELANQREKMVFNEYTDIKSLQKPTPNPSISSANFHVKIPIIMYHYIEYVKDRGDKTRISLAITPYELETELQKLTEEHYTTYFVKDMPDILDGTIHKSDKSIMLTFDDGYEDFYTDAFPLLKKYNAKATLYVINNYIGRKGYLTLAELKELASSGLVEIGAHTMDHIYLKGSNPTLVKLEIFDSKADLEQKLGINIKTFAYPYGAFDDTAIQAVKEASFSAAVSVIPGNVHSKNELFYLYRIRAGSFLGPYMLENIEKNFDEK